MSKLCDFRTVVGSALLALSLGIVLQVKPAAAQTIEADSVDFEARGFDLPQTESDVDRRQRNLLENDQPAMAPAPYRRFEPRVSDVDVEVDEGVYFHQHFQRYHHSDNQEVHRDVRTGAIVGAGGMLSLAVAVKLKRMGEIARLRLLSSNESDVVLARSFIQKIKRSKMPSRLFLASGLYLIADANSGLVIALYGYRPVYFVNAPALAVFMARKANESTAEYQARFKKTVVPPVAAELKILKDTIMGDLK